MLGKYSFQRKQNKSKRIGIIVLIAMLVVVVYSGFSEVGNAYASVPPTTSGWNLKFSDDFNGAAGSGLNTANWRYDTGTGWGTGEIENMSSSTNNVFQDGNGNLVIRAIRDSSGNWTSGRIESQMDTLAAPAGGILKVQARIQLPDLTGSAAQGYWPAFWMLGTPIRNGTNTWPNGGEVDIMESVNGQNTDYSHIHCGTNPGGPCGEPNGIGGSSTGFSPSLESSFHTYTVEYDRSVSPEQIRYYCDGVNFKTIYSNQVDATTWNNAMHHGFFIIFDLAMGGGWPGNPTASTVSGGEMKVDYVAAWTKNGGSSSSNGITDPLNDYSMTYSHSNNMMIDTSNPSYFNNDGARASRSTDKDANFVYKLNNISSTKVTLYYYGNTNHINLWASSDGVNYTQLNANQTTPTATSSGWYSVTYSLSSMPTNTNYLKIEIPPSGTAWTPQVGQVQISQASQTTTTTDPLNDYSQTYSHTGNLFIDTSNPGYFNSDGARASRTADTDANFVYKYNNITSANVTLYYYGNTNNLKLWASSDGVNYTQLNPSQTTPAATSAGWYAVTYSVSNMPSNTGYLKVEIPPSGLAWAPQVGQVQISHQ